MSFAHPIKSTNHVKERMRLYMTAKKIEKPSHIKTGLCLTGTKINFETHELRTRKTTTKRPQTTPTKRRKTFKKNRVPDVHARLELQKTYSRNLLKTHKDTLFKPELFFDSSCIIKFNSPEEEKVRLMSKANYRHFDAAAAAARAAVRLRKYLKNMKEKKNNEELEKLLFCEKLRKFNEAVRAQNLTYNQSNQGKGKFTMKSKSDFLSNKQRSVKLDKDFTTLEQEFRTRKGKLERKLSEAMENGDDLNTEAIRQEIQDFKDQANVFEAVAHNYHKSHASTTSADFSGTDFQNVLLEEGTNTLNKGKRSKNRVENLKLNKKVNTNRCKDGRQRKNKGSISSFSEDEMISSPRFGDNSISETTSDIDEAERRADDFFQILFQDSAENELSQDEDALEMFIYDDEYSNVETKLLELQQMMDNCDNEEERIQIEKKMLLLESRQHVREKIDDFMDLKISHERMSSSKSENEFQVPEAVNPAFSTNKFRRLVKHVIKENDPDPMLLTTLFALLVDMEEIIKENISQIQLLQNQIVSHRRYPTDSDFNQLPPYVCPLSIEAESQDPEFLLQCIKCGWKSTLPTSWTSRISSSCERCLENYYSTQEKALRTEVKNLLESNALLQKLYKVEKERRALTFAHQIQNACWF